ncbi:hypothetical protein MMC25_007210 [Agyrium rufum]|nr:hypothetical protein [Agyrium rufum]
MLQAGICGTEKDGAFAVAVSGMYSSIDSDSQNSIWYSCPGSTKNTDTLNPPVNSGTKAMRTSYIKHYVIRVIRSSGGRSKICPRVGFRYDGLYEIVEERRNTNNVGGAYTEFKLERLGGQADINLSRPSKEEVEMYRKISEYY